MYNTKKINEKLRQGEILLGTHINGGSQILTECIAGEGFDVLWIDTEHSSIGKENLLPLLIAARSGGTPAFVRIPWNDPVMAKPVLDMGADGIIFPYVRTRGETEAAVAACEYPPRGIRGYGPMRALDYGRISPYEYVTNTYREMWRLIQIEHIDAVKNLRDIVKVDGIDAYIFGPNDLAGSCGLIGQPRHPDMMGVYDEACAILRESGKVFGVSIGYDPAVISEWINRGCQIIFAGSEISYVQEGASNVFKNLNILSKQKEK